MPCVLSLSKTRSITVRGDQARYMGISGRFIDGYDFPLESSPRPPGFIKGPNYLRLRYGWYAPTDSVLIFRLFLSGNDYRTRLIGCYKDVKEETM